MHLNAEHGAWRFVGVLAIFGMLAFSGLVAADTSSVRLPDNILLSQEPMSPNGDWKYALDDSDHLWLGYYDNQRLLRLRDPSGEERLIVPDNRAQAPSGLEMIGNGSGVSVLWRDKHPKKGLYLLDSAHIEQMLEVDADSDALARFTAAHAGKDGLLDLLWYGEKIGEPSGAPYNLYFRQLDTRTKQFSPTVLLMPGIYPVMSSDAAGNTVVYSWVQEDGSSRIVARYKSAKSEIDTQSAGFGAPVTIADPPTIVPIFQSFTSGSRWFVIWLAQYGDDRRDFLLEGAYSDDPEKGWTRFSIEQLRGYDVGSVQVASDPDGHILLALMARPLAQRDNKPDIYLVRSADRGTTWLQPYRLRRGAELTREPTEHFLDAFNARYPSITFGGRPGEVLVVWEDWRDIRSGVYASLSQDYGKTWVVDNVPLTREFGKNVGLRYEPNAAYFGHGKFHVITEKSTSDALVEKQLVELSFSADDLITFSRNAEQQDVLLDSKKLKQRLERRVDEYWSAMKAKDFEMAYKIQDPFFRAKVSEKDYLSKMGKILYSEAKPLEIKMNGAVADAVVKVRASVPSFESPVTGKAVTESERELSLTGRWLYIDGDWYRQFYIETLNKTFTHY